MNENITWRSVSRSFLDEKTAEKIGWKEVFAAWQPVTAGGVRFKENLRPYLPGNEVDLLHVHELLALDLQRISPEELRRWREWLRQLPDIQPLLASLALDTLELTPKTALWLKQTVQSTLHLLKESQIPPGLDYLTISDMESLLKPFGHPELSHFAVQHLADSFYLEAQHEEREIKKKLTQYQTEWLKTLQKQGWPLYQRPDSTLMISLPVHRDLLELVKSTPNLRVLRETPFEIILQRVPDDVESELLVAWENAFAKLQQETDRLLAQLTEQVQRQLQSWNRLADALQEMDIRLSKVALARVWQGVVPSVSERWSLREARHPLLAEQLQQQGRSFVAIDLPDVGTLNVITGSNMGGKSVTLCVIALMQCLLQYGLPVPAVSFTAPLLTGVRLLFAAGTQMEHGLSAFGQEVVGWGSVLEEAEHQALLLLFDEPGCTTNPQEGEALVHGLLHKLSGLQDSIVFLASHYASVAAYQGAAHWRVRGLSSVLHQDMQNATLAERLRFLAAAMDYRLERRQPGQGVQEALEVAKWLGLPDSLLQVARRYQETEGRMNI